MPRGPMLEEAEMIDGIRSIKGGELQAVYFFFYGDCD